MTEIASGGTLQAAPTLTGGVLRGGGQVSGNVTNTSGTVRPGTSPGTLTVTGNYAQGAAGVLVVDVAGTARGTQYDHLSVGGAAALDGTLAVVQAGGFTPQPTDAFAFLTSASRTGTFATLVGAQLPGGKRYGLDYPGAPDFGARLLGPADLVITDCDDPALATITEVTGDLIVDGLADCDALELPNLTEVAGDLIITDLPSADDGRAELVGHGRRPLDPRPPVGGDGRAELVGHGRRPLDPRPPVGGHDRAQLVGHGRRPLDHSTSRRRTRSRSTRWTRPATSRSSTTGPER